MARGQIDNMSPKAILWWRLLMVVLVALTIWQVALGGQFGILAIWAVPIYQLTHMSPPMRRRLFGRGSSSGG